MDSQIITRNVSKLCIYPPTESVFGSLNTANLPNNEPDQFASAMAHEVRNPLSNINLAVEMLKCATKEDERKVYLDIIMRSSVRINDLVNDFLISFQTDGMDLKAHSIHQLLDEVLAMNKDRIMLKGIQLRKDYTTMDCNVLVNRQKIKLALTNIILNAIDSMPHLKGKLKILTKSVNGECVVEIEDSGIGISSENLKHIFKPYFTNKVNGMGVGLSTTLDILLSNHVRVDVQSEEGRGTRFILSFDLIHQIQKCAADKVVSMMI